jgi:hypothetical protein
MHPKNENIEFTIDFLSDDIGNKNDNDLTRDNILNISSIQDFSNKNNNEYNFANHLNYSMNYTVKELLIICDFYNIAKELKSKKANKDNIISAIQIYENDPKNYESVAKRHNFWFYMNELKNDKFMKKFILW